MMCAVLIRTDGSNNFEVCDSRGCGISDGAGFGLIKRSVSMSSYLST